MSASSSLPGPFNQVASEEVEISIKEMLGAIATFQEKLKVNNDSLKCISQRE